MLKSLLTPATKSLAEILASFSKTIDELGKLQADNQAQIEANGAEVKRIIDETADLKHERDRAAGIAAKLQSLLS